MGFSLFADGFFNMLQQKRPANPYDEKLFITGTSHWLAVIPDVLSKLDMKGL